MKLHTSIITVLLGTTAVACQAANWGYTGKVGPENWASLNDGHFELCGSGLEQSPIDIPGTQDNTGALKPLVHNFKPATMNVLNNGHTIQVNIANDSTTTTELGTQKLLQFHFHTPSENHVGGKSYPMEAHFVHKNDDGMLSVVGVFFELGEENEELAAILDMAPSTKSEAKEPSKTLDIAGLLGTQATSDYYRFNGSLTTPPCSEGVQWYVSRQVQTASQEQISAFEKLFHGNNARPVQPLNERTVSLNKK